MEPPMTTIFQGFVDRATIYPMVEVVARLDAWKLEFRGSPCLAELGSSEIAPVHAKTPRNAVPTDGANVEGPKLLLTFNSRVGTVSSGFGVVGGKNEKMTQDLPWFGQWGLRPLSLFSLILSHPFTIEWGGPYIGYMGNRERGIQNNWA